MESSLHSLITDVISPMDAPLSEDIQDSPRDCFQLELVQNKFNFPVCAP